MKLKCYSWLLCFSRYVIIAGLQKWISKWAAMEYRKVLTPWLTWKKKFWILDKKALQKIEGHDLSDPLSRFCWPCIVIYHMKSLSVSLSVSVSLSLSVSVSLCLCLSVSVSLSLSLSLSVSLYIYIWHVITRTCVHFHWNN